MNMEPGAGAVGGDESLRPYKAALVQMGHHAYVRQFGAPVDKDDVRRLDAVSYTHLYELEVIFRDGYGDSGVRRKYVGRKDFSVVDQSPWR